MQVALFYGTLHDAPAGETESDAASVETVILGVSTHIDVAAPAVRIAVIA